MHRGYIRQCLDNFTDNSGVIQLIGAEFTGPLHFVQFWIDVIKEWEKEKNRKVTVGLSTTKDVQDAILADAQRAAVIDLIDIRYWHHQANGTTYAPAGGQNLAPRQHARLLNPKKTSFEQVYRAVSEYRQKYPDKAVMYSADNSDAFCWAVLMAGGSLASIPPIADTQFLKDVSIMKPIASQAANQWVLGNEKAGFVIYKESAEAVKLDLTQINGSFSVSFINPKTGEVAASGEKIKGGEIIEVKNQIGGNTVVWLQKMNN